jgi:hypothetical protein
MCVTDKLHDSRIVTVLFQPFLQSPVTKAVCLLRTCVCMDILSVCASIGSVLRCFIDIYDSSGFLPTRVGDTNNGHSVSSHFGALLECRLLPGYTIWEPSPGREYYWICVFLSVCAAVL